MLPCYSFGYKLPNHYFTLICVNKLYILYYAFFTNMVNLQQTTKSYYTDIKYHKLIYIIMNI